MNDAKLSSEKEKEIMKAILRGKEIDCRIINKLDDKWYIEYSKMCYYNNSTCGLDDHPSELIKQSVREWVKIDELVIMEKLK